MKDWLAGIGLTLATFLANPTQAQNQFNKLPDSKQVEIVNTLKSKGGSFANGSPGAVYGQYSALVVSDRYLDNYVNNHYSSYYRDYRYGGRGGR